MRWSIWTLHLACDAESKQTYSKQKLIIFNTRRGNLHLFVDGRRHGQQDLKHLLLLESDDHQVLQADLLVGRGLALVESFVQSKMRDKKNEIRQPKGAQHLPDRTHVLVLHHGHVAEKLQHVGQHLELGRLTLPFEALPTGRPMRGLSKIGMTTGKRNAQTYSAGTATASRSIRTSRGSTPRPSSAIFCSCINCGGTKEPV